MTKNIAVIGYGLGGRIFHAPYVQAVDGLHLAAIVSSKRDEIAKAHPGVSIEADVEAVFSNPAIDAVVISTPNDTHAALAERALAAGKHVVVDKPFAQTTGEATALIEKAKGRVLTVFHNRRWDSDFLTLKKLIRDGSLGEIVYVESHFDVYRPTVRQRWREQAGLSSGIWYDLGSHLADQILNLFGAPETVMADIDHLRPDGVTPDYFRVLLGYGRLRVVLVGNNLSRETLRWAVHGTKASYIKHGRDPQEPHLVDGGMISDTGFGIDHNPGTLVLPGGAVTVPAAIKGDYRAFYENFRDCLNGVAPLAVTTSQAFDVMRLLEIAQDSSVQRRQLRY